MLAAKGSFKASAIAVSASKLSRKASGLGWITRSKELPNLLIDVVGIGLGMD